MEPAAPNTRRTERRHLPAFLLVVAGVSLSVATFVFTRAAGEAALESEFQRRAGDRAQSIRRSLDEQFAAVRAIGAFVGVAGVPTQRTFEEFVAPLYEQLDVCQALSWAPRVAPEVVEAHERAALREGVSRDYHVWTRTGEHTPGLDRYPVHYIHPQAGNIEALGFDLASHPARLEALQRARDLGALSVTAGLTLVQESEDKSAGVLFVFPCYGGPVPETPEERRASLIGFVTGVVRIGDLVQVGLAFFEPGGLDMDLFDASDPERPVLFHEHLERAGGAASRASGAFRASLPIQVGERTWSAEFRSAPAFENLRSRAPLGLLLGGLFLTLAVSGWAFAHVHFAARRERLIADREVALRDSADARAALQASEVGLERTLDSLNEVVWKIDRASLAPVYLNSAAQTVLGRPARDFIEDPALWYAIAHPADVETLRSLMNRAQDEGSAAGEYRVLHPGGEVRWLQVRAARRDGYIEGLALDVTSQMLAEEQRRALADELDHRVKNILAMVTGLAQQSFVEGQSSAEFRAAFDGRLRAMARAHDALAHSQWRGVELAELVRIILHASDASRLDVLGEPVLLPARISGPIGLVLNELETNAIKYGALAADEGTVSIRWLLEEDVIVTLDWIEDHPRGVPPDPAPGIGTRLLKGLIEHQLGGRVRVEYRVRGVHWRLRFALAADTALDVPSSA